MTILFMLKDMVSTMPTKLGRVMCRACGCGFTPTSNQQHCCDECVIF